ncbi:D-alanyl-D-alanine carboxypeptidase (penicillin-binding protein 5/6) [Prosthecobacter fusiformis]|uniref:D-alanyl-D-alanine carboxypeptidase (Penicillin-binding protein 5/6) n=1 Tax=Prosthecobacter fusiformis TaxID=48464 RepID=A0A4R7RNW7_9BACT|nr:D-alanyl-D-alanine carboxypeptidase family protein [Prosthecobacter fusiformis]TDU66508.1 D-alanyl-D-alanine carboxypeptidase (penicillin-binding protein 5/6) [Prosthecobacter fusiformis]
MLAPLSRFLLVSCSGLLITLLSACSSPSPQRTVRHMGGGDFSSNTGYVQAAYPIASPAAYVPATYHPGWDVEAAPQLIATSGSPAIHAAAYLLIDAHTGRHLASKNAESARAVASTQKLVTALVILDAGNLDKPVTVTAADVKVEPTCLGLRPGEVYTRRHLLYAFLIKSCNDVANVLARDNAGSISAFAGKMNAKARSLGCSNSNFKNPHGLTVSGQYSTARDMARISMAAYRNPIIRDAVRRSYYTFRRNNGNTVTLKSTNNLLGNMPECNGMKTGYTVASGRCLISTASYRGRDVILVQLGTQTKYIWDDGRALMSWGLQRAKGGSLTASR